jgi:hypothetical protein
VIVLTDADEELARVVPQEEEEVLEEEVEAVVEVPLEPEVIERGIQEEEEDAEEED